MFMAEDLQKYYVQTLFLPSSSQESYKCTNLKHEILSAEMFSAPFMCSNVKWLTLAISVPQLFTFEFSTCAVRNLCKGAWSHFMVTFASQR